MLFSVAARSLLLSFVLLLCGLAWPATEATLGGTVRDSTGAAIPGAEVSIRDARQALVRAEKTGAQGRFRFEGMVPGRYLLVASSPGFAEARVAVVVSPSQGHDITVTLDPEPVYETVTVTAHPGMVEAREAVAQQVNLVGAEEIRERAKSVVAQVAAEEPGVQLQRTSPTIAGIFVRGLTGNKVNVFLDGVPYTTGAMRGGINTFLSLIEPSSLETVEILRGPSSAQYGSDALGGSVQFLERMPPLHEGGGRAEGSLDSFWNSADSGLGSSLRVSYAARRFGALANLAGRRSNRLRTGQDLDSHNAVTRFFGLPSSVVASGRLPDTGFTQYGGVVKLLWAPSPGRQWTARYSRSQQDGGRRYDQLLGGDGNLVADLRNLMGDLFYLRFSQSALGGLENFTAAYWFNSQREERVNQGGNGNPRASIGHEYERTRVHGLQLSAARHWGALQSLLLGGEFQNQRVTSPAFSWNPVTGAFRTERPRVPNKARYRAGGVYAQDVFEAVPQRLRLIGNVRYGGAAYRSRAADSPILDARPLWPDDSLRASSLTFRAGAVVFPVEGWSLYGNVSRGFRAPHITDLGTLGLTGSGFEVAAPDVTGLGATIGTSADRTAVSTGKPVTQVRPETSLSYEAGTRARYRGIETEVTFFLNDVHDLISKQALILPSGAVGLALGSQAVVAQAAGGAVFVPASSNPVLVRANFGDARLYGVEHTLRARLSAAWTATTVFTYLRARDSAGLPPNVEGGTPAPEGYLKLRYAPAGRRLWLEPYFHLAGRQDRLSSLDLEDRRIGAMRSRAGIRNFFLNGATARGLVAPGPDALLGTADDFLKFTGETLPEIQDRVLGRGVDAAPLFTGVPGYVTFNLRGGFRLGERHDVLFDFENIGDRNYRGMSWGLDAPGRALFVRFRTRW